MTPNELLHAAATRARELDAAATPGPWQVDGPWWHERPGAGPDPTVVVTASARRDAVLIGIPEWHPTAGNNAANAACVAAARSVLGPLADLLEAVEGYIVRTGREPGVELLAVARALLGPEADRG